MSTQFNIDPPLVAVINATVRIYLNEFDSVISFNDSILNGALRINTRKSVRGPNSFEVEFAPSEIKTLLVTSNTSNILGGNYSSDTLTSLVTPMSVITITLRRGNQEYPVFFGIVSEIRESYRRTNKKVIRTITLSGTDLQYYLTNFSYFTLTWLGPASSAIPGNIPFIKLSQAGALTGTPWFMGTVFYSFITASYMQYTFLNTGSGPHTFSYLNNICFGTFNTIPSVDSEIQLNFPLLVNFYATEGTWWNKFQTFFPFPLYEMFYISLLNDQPQATEVPIYPSAINTGIPQPVAVIGGPASTEITSTSANTVAVDGLNTTYNVQNCFVARQLPFPQLRINSLAGTTNLVSAASSLSVVTSGWDALGEYVFQTTNPILEADIQFDNEGARSFYILNPTQMSTMYGGKGVNAATWLYMISGVGAIVDPVYLAVYGYRPEIVGVEWLSSALNNATPNISDNSMNILCVSMLLTTAANYNALPLMASGIIKIPLSPQILPGNKFTCSPFKEGTTWTFYIEDVLHSYEFGEVSHTELKVIRGLPTSLYNDSTFLLQLLTGQIERVNNQYQIIQRQLSIAFNNIGLTFLLASNAQKLLNSAGSPLAIPQGQ